MPKPCHVDKPAELLAYLFASWPETKKTQIRSWLKFQAVTVNGRPVTQFNHALKPGDVVDIRSESATHSKVLPSGIRILHEDALVIVIEKPENLLTMGTESEQEKTAFFQLTEYLNRGKQNGRERAWIVHRLDRDTSGLMVFAKSSEVAATLQTGWDKVEKRYEAVAEGSLASNSGVFESELNESNPAKVFITPATDLTRHAVTHYRVLKRGKGRTLVELTLETGRRHQIRVQLAEAGCPIVGDKKYGAKSNPAKRLALHACLLRFPHPGTKKELCFHSPLPKELVRLV